MMAIMDSDGNNRKLLNYGTLMTWYPEGDSILFYYNSQAEVGIDNSMLYSIDTSGNNWSTVTDIYTGDNDISPDGEHIVFTSDFDSYMGLTVFDFPEFTNPTHVGPRGVNPVYSNDGLKIAFTAIDEEEDYNTIYVMNSDGTNLHKIVENNTTQHFTSPAWSPHDDKLIYISYSTDGYNRRYLNLIDLSDSCYYQILSDSSVTSCSWSR